MAIMSGSEFQYFIFRGNYDQLCQFLLMWMVFNERFALEMPRLTLCGLEKDGLARTNDCWWFCGIVL